MSVQGPKSVNNNTAMVDAVKRFHEARQSVASAATPVSGMSGANPTGTRTETPLENHYEVLGPILKKEEKKQIKSDPVLPDYNNVVLASEMLEIDATPSSKNFTSKAVNSYEITSERIDDK